MAKPVRTPARVTLPSFSGAGSRSHMEVVVGDLSYFVVVSLPMWDLGVCVPLFRPLQYLFQ